MLQLASTSTRQLSVVKAAPPPRTHRRSLSSKAVTAAARRPVFLSPAWARLVLLHPGVVRLVVWSVVVMTMAKVTSVPRKRDPLPTLGVEFVGR